MTNIQLIEAQCRIEQVQTVLGFWLEGASPSNRDKLMIGAVMSLLNGVPEAIQEADELLGKYELSHLLKCQNIIKCISLSLATPQKPLIPSAGRWKTSSIR